jgi:hypothetical protein
MSESSQDRDIKASVLIIGGDLDLEAETPASRLAAITIDALDPILKALKSQPEGEPLLTTLSEILIRGGINLMTEQMGANNAAAYLITYAAYSGPIRPPIPLEGGHPIRSNPASHSGAFRPPVPE